MDGSGVQIHAADARGAPGLQASAAAHAFRSGEKAAGRAFKAGRNVAGDKGGRGNDDRLGIAVDRCPYETGGQDGGADTACRADTAGRNRVLAVAVGRVVRCVIRCSHIVMIVMTVIIVIIVMMPVIDLVVMGMSCGGRSCRPGSIMRRTARQHGGGGNPLHGDCHDE